MESSNEDREREQCGALLNRLKQMAQNQQAPAGIRALVAEGIRLLENRLSTSSS